MRFIFQKSHNRAKRTTGNETETETERETETDADADAEAEKQQRKSCTNTACRQYKYK